MDFEVPVRHHSGGTGVMFSGHSRLSVHLSSQLVLWAKEGYSWQTDIVEAILSERDTDSAWVIETWGPMAEFRETVYLKVDLILMNQNTCLIKIWVYIMVWVSHFLNEQSQHRNDEFFCWFGNLHERFHRDLKLISSLIVHLTNPFKGKYWIRL